MNDTLGRRVRLFLWIGEWDGVDVGIAHGCEADVCFLYMYEHAKDMFPPFIVVLLCTNIEKQDCFKIKVNMLYHFFR